jgi:hypothetical protein
MHLGLLLIDDIRQVNGGRVGAKMALHDPATSAREGVRERSVPFQLSNPIPQTSRILVGLGRHGDLELLAQFQQFGLHFPMTGGPPGRFAAVPRLAMNAFQEGRQFLLELGIVMGATESARVAKLDEFQTTDGALPLIENRRFVVIHEGGLGLFLAAGLRIVKVLLSTFLAQVQFLEPIVGEHFGDV